MRHKSSLQIPDDARTQAVASIRQYFTSELDQEIGDLKAALLLDYFLVEIAPAVYNVAISDAKAFFDERIADLPALYTRDELTYWAAPKKSSR